MQANAPNIVIDATNVRPIHFGELTIESVTPIIGQHTFSCVVKAVWRRVIRSRVSPPVAVAVKIVSSNSQQQFNRPTGLWGYD